MESRMQRYNRQVSPERAKVWREKSPTYHYNHHCKQQEKDNNLNNLKVSVVYYLCRNQQLEHPHFMEVPLSSSDSLYLRDVIERLNVLRGRGMGSKYSWSCKRSYRNGYVWHDLCYDDVILPAHGNEYVLKGSELIQESNYGPFIPTETSTLHNQKTLQEPPSSKSIDDSSSPSSLNGKTRKSSRDDEPSPPAHCDGLANASTQTEENNEPLDHGNTHEKNQVSEVKQTHEISVSPPSSTTPSSLSCRIDTLESLIIADIRKLKSFRIRAEEGFGVSSNTKLKASHMILQLISCGSISVKDHSFGRIQSYKPSFLYSKNSTPSLMFRGFDCQKTMENPQLILEDKEHVSGSLSEMNTIKEGVPTLQRSSYKADRNTQNLDSIEDKEDGNSMRCIPRSIKASLSKQPRCESMRVDSSRVIASATLDNGSKIMKEPLCVENQSRKLSLRLSSGALVVIQSKVSPDS